jgi:hypothetical protein
MDVLHGETVGLNGHGKDPADWICHFLAETMIPLSAARPMIL